MHAEHHALFRKHRALNSYQGHGFGLGLAVVTDAAVAGLPAAAAGTAWWQGLGSCFFAVQPAAGVGCVLLAQHMPNAGRSQALADLLKFVHENVVDSEAEASTLGAATQTRLVLG